MFLLREISEHYVTREDTFLLTKTLMFSGQDRELTADVIEEQNKRERDLQNIALSSIRTWYERARAGGEDALLDPSKWLQRVDACELKNPFTQGDISHFADCIKKLNDFITLGKVSFFIFLVQPKFNGV